MESLIPSIKKLEVALFMGAWIEIKKWWKKTEKKKVALFMGAWIEISKKYNFSSTVSSHSSWVRGLKFY
ncbi:hypothetical protein NST17_16115 [Caldifermentibacillus hisashii]|uniref:Uncharacterized protein n=1 Tax=Caldifermentibacillus hisashii TaxID=996558 RepID=A0ABU9K1Q7_9BACI